MAGSIEGQMIGALPRMVWNATCSGTFAAAKTYKSAIDNTYYAVLGATECTVAATSAACAIWQRGLTGNLKELAKECGGINNLQKAKDELTKSVVQVKDKEVRRPLSERVGAAGGEVVNAVAKFTATSTALTMGTAWAVGTACNVAGQEFAATNLLGASQLTATGLNTIGSLTVGVVAIPVRIGVGVGVSAIQTGATMLWNHPVGAAITTGVGSLLYLASHEMIKTSEATGTASKVFHGTMATMAAFSAVAAPVAYALM